MPSFKEMLIAAAVLGLAASTAIKPNYQEAHNSPRSGVDNPSSQQVTSSQAFNTGAGNRNNANYNDGTGNAGTDTYKCYYGSYTGFPDKSKWIEYESMFNHAKQAMRDSCANLGSGAFGPGDSDQQIGLLWNSIQSIAQSSLVDHRFILATIMQEVCLLLANV